MTTLMLGSHLPLRFLLLLVLCCVHASSIFLAKNPVVGLSACHPSHLQPLVQFKDEFDSRGCNQTEYFNGVWCDNTTGVVTKLQLPSGCLSGTLYPNSSLFSLRHLRFLSLSYNDFTSSPVPTGFGNLKKLEVLTLSSNGFIGEVPSSFNNLSQLSILDLSHNELTGSFLFVRNLSKLSLLDLSNNHFSTLEPNSSLFSLRHLLLLSLSHNNFISSSLPSTFGNLNRLEFLDLSLNAFQGQVPSSFSNLSQLSELYLSHNELSGSLSLLQNLTKLSILNLAYNHFFGTIPFSLFTMPLLSDLDLKENHFTTFPIELPNSSSSTKLVSLSLGHNPLDGQILKPISKLINLRHLDLSSLNIGYPIDLNFFSSFESLTFLGLSGNSVSKTSLSSYFGIPLSLETVLLSDCDITEFPNILKPLQNLMLIDISKNRIEGKVPAWLWSLPRLIALDFYNNSVNGFQGSAEVLGNSSLQMLYMDANYFEGPLPNLPLSITIFSVGNNNFTGNIPLSICNCNHLKLLDLSYNSFTGSIPQCLSNLKTLSLRKNNLEGPLPDIFFAGSSLSTLDVGYNQLTGKLPRSLINCSSLRLLSVNNNKIKDRFPFWLKALPNLQVLILRSNNLYGYVSPPDEGPLGFPELRIFEISDNKFTGSLPPSYFVNWKVSSHQINKDGSMYMNYQNKIKDAYTTYDDVVDLQYKGLIMERQMVLTAYSTIDFSGNKIEGQIPESIGLLKGLIALNLSNNAFTGHIPLSLASLTELESLDMSKNQLSGTIPNGLKTLSFLAFVNLSHNKLKGEIPQGAQIIGQPKSSFEGNLGLCGLPLEESCFGTDVPPTRQPEEDDEEKEREQVLNWKGVALGYGTGVLLGLVIAHVIASYKPEWLAKIICANKRETR